MSPPMTKPVTVSTPGPSTGDPVTGNDTPGPLVSQETLAWLSQNSVVETGAQIELNAVQDTTISLWTFLCPLGVPLTSKSTVTDVDGRKFVVVGQPAQRPDHRPRWQAASLRLISDMQ